MAGLMEFFQPVHILLLENLAHGEKVDHSAPRFHAARGLNGIAFGFVVEIPFLVVPMGVLPPREVPRHLEIQRDRDQRLVRWGRRTRLLNIRLLEEWLLLSSHGAAAEASSCPSDPERVKEFASGLESRGGPCLF